MVGGSLGVISNQADWIGSFLLTDADTGDALDLTGWTFTLNARPEDRDCWSGTFAGAAYVTNPDPGVIQWVIPAEQIASFSQGNHAVSLIMTSADNDKRQLFLGTVSVEQGF